MNYRKYNQVFVNSLLLVLIAISCNDDITKSGEDDSYILLEIKRTIAFTCLILDSACGSVNIDFAGYGYDEESKNLEINRFLDSRFGNSDNFDAICAVGKRLYFEGDYSGSGGGVIPIFDYPLYLEMNGFPLIQVDTLEIVKVGDQSRFDIIFRNQTKRVNSGSTLIWAEQMEVDSVVANLGRFSVCDTIRIINRGVLKKSNIIYPYKP